MENKSCEILSLKKREIAYKNIKHKKYRTFGLFALIIISTCVVLGSIKYNNADYLQDVTAIINPQYSIYDEYGGVIFTNAEIYFVKESPNFTLPVIPKSIENNNGSLLFAVENYTLFAPEDGIVLSIFLNDKNERCLKILHSENCTSIISNINILGVGVGEAIKKGQKIGTVKPEQSIKFSVFCNDILQNTTYENNKIVWKN